MIKIDPLYVPIAILVPLLLGEKQLIFFQFLQERVNLDTFISHTANTWLFAPTTLFPF